MNAAWRLTLASYNIHIGIGRDGQLLPERIAHVLTEVGADVVALQEVRLGPKPSDMLSCLCEATGYDSIAGPTLTHPLYGIYGNALLTRHKILAVNRIDLTVQGCEPRGALDVKLDCGTHEVRVMATHLGLSPVERRMQVRKLLSVIEQYPALMITILLGDLNEWFLWGRPLRWLHRHFEETPAPRSFPAGFPVFSLDRIWVKPRSLLRRITVHASPLARLASDHLPVVAELGSQTGLTPPPAHQTASAC